MRNIEIPSIEICEGWVAEDLVTEDDCDDAFAYLTGAIVSIEARLEDMEISGQDNGDLYIRTRGALRWKKAALQVVQQMRGKIARKQKDAQSQHMNNRLLMYFRVNHQDTFDAALSHVSRRIEAERLGVVVISEGVA